MEDPIVKEVREIREKIIAQYISIREFHEAMMEYQKQFKDQLVSFPTKKRYRN